MRVTNHVTTLMDRVLDRVNQGIMGRHVAQNAIRAFIAKIASRNVDSVEE